jgi:hypothetical protein
VVLGDVAERQAAPDPIDRARVADRVGAGRVASGPLSAPTAPGTMAA